MATVADLRMRQDAEVAYLLVIDGISTCWVTDHGPGEELLGGASGTWMGASEASIGREDGRTVRPGLQIPTSIRMSLDHKTGQLQASTYTFRILDLADPGEAGSLATLFSAEAKDYDTLRTHIDAGTAALASTISTSDGLIDPAGKHIGTEAIGSARERHAFSWYPSDVNGPQHAVASLVDNEKLAPIKVSDDPIVWIGRKWALYRVYKDIDAYAGTYADWPLWDAQISAGALMCWGRLSDNAEYEGDKVWSVKCHGPHSLLQKQLGNGADTGWISIIGHYTLTADESRAAVIPYRHSFATDGYDHGGATPYDSKLFSDITLAGTTKAELIDELETHIAEAIAGTNTSYASSIGEFDSETILASGTVALASDYDLNSNAGIDADGSIWVTRNRVPATESIQDLGVGAYPVGLRIILHEKVWRLLGYEIQTQNVAFAIREAPEDVPFFRVDPGTPILGENSPAIDGYWNAFFDTGSLGRVMGQGPSLGDDPPLWYNNGGATRYYYPKFKNPGTFFVKKDGHQAIRIYDGDFGGPYLTRDPLIPIHELAVLGGSACDSARYAAIRAKVATLKEKGVTAADLAKGGEADTEDFLGIVKLCWRAGNDHGQVLELTHGGQTGHFFYIERFEDPRSFGIDAERPKFDIMAIAGDEKARVEIMPINTLAYMGESQVRGEPVFSIVPMLMHSTGSAGGWSGTIGGGTQPTYDTGDNQQTNESAMSLVFSQDVLAAEMGLGIHSDFVASPDTWRLEFDKGIGGDGEFNRCRFAFSGPFGSDEVIRSCMETRGLYMSLHGRQYAPFRMEQVSIDDVDISIGEDDLYGNPTNPSSVIPKQSTRFSGPIDGVRFRYRNDLLSGTTTLEHFERARDEEASERFGTNIHEVKDVGALPYGPNGWYKAGGVGWMRRFREIWKYDRPGFFGSRNFVITLAVSRPKGQDLYPGSRVRVTNPWVYNPSGSYGITNVTGRVLSATHYTDRTEVQIVIFAGQGAGIRLCAPIAKVLYVDGTTIGLESNNWLGHDGTDNDIEFFTEPSWSDTGGSAVVRIMEYDGDVCTLSGSSTVVSTDTVNLTVTTNTTISVNQFTDKWLVMDSHANQSGAWPASTFGVVVGSDFNFGGTRGFRYH